MLLRIALGLAILAGLAALYVTHVQVGGKITELTTNLTDTQGQLAQTQQAKAEADASLKVTRAQLDTSNQAYSQATNDLAQAFAKVAEQQERADKASANLLDVTGQRNEAQQELSQWRVFGMSVEQIRNQLARLRDAERARDTFATDNQVLAKKLAKTERDLAKFTGNDVAEIVLPAGTKGSIVAVDPKFDFVVLDIGGNQGLVEDAKMLVNRDGKLIGKVRITQVEASRAIANVMPEWKQDEIMEGDQVIF